MILESARAPLVIEEASLALVLEQHRRGQYALSVTRVTLAHAELLRALRVHLEVVRFPQKRLQVVRVVVLRIRVLHLSGDAVDHLDHDTVLEREDCPLTLLRLALALELSDSAEDQEPS